LDSVYVNVRINEPWNITQNIQLHLSCVYNQESELRCTTLIVTLLVRKLPAFYGTRRFLTIVTRSRY